MNLDDLLKNIPVGDIAQKLGVDQSTAEAAVQQAVPALLGGMTANAQSAEGAQKLESALAKHQVADAKIDLNAIDTEDGEKIVGHVFGEKKSDVVAALGSQGGGGMGDLIGKLLPMLAPIVMGMLANSMSKGSESTQAESSGGGIGDLLGGLLGGGGSSSNAGGGLGDLLGGLLGGGKK